MAGVNVQRRSRERSCDWPDLCQECSIIDTTVVSCEKDMDGMVEIA